MAEARTEPDKIHIRDLLLRCVLGVYEAERKDRQDVVIHITMEADLRQAARSDRIQDTVNYKEVKQRVIELVDRSSFFLVERLAEAIADVCLQEPRVQRVRVRVEKPAALRFARTVEVEIVRERPADG
ncbi:MAG: dihydroneopterin aldolase [Phycisphaerae bacterium SM23_33]|jgi:D-erythro-7,8-dihydroneopterin triphosphate epimerase|nr:MAG: dihydroneopterin aldolase [Phycisphaerae bacterium SM23_33]